MRSFCISAFSRTGFTRRTKNTWKPAYLFLLLLLLSGNQFLHGQAIGGGQIQGAVTDETGSAVSGATVEAVQTESGLHRIVTSGDDGGYNLPSLPVGPYTLKVTATGFSTYNQSGIVIQVGNQLRVDVKLQVGGVSQTVQVQAAASMVQTEDQSITQVVGTYTRQLLLSGWQLAPIVTATTGVPFTVTTGTDASLTGVGQDPTLIGNPRAQNTKITTWLNKASFAANTAGTYGQTRPFEFYGPHYTNVDTALSKFIPLHEALQLEARAERFNCFNHTNYANPGGAINGSGTGVTNPGTALSSTSFGTILAANPPRILQLSLKMDF